MGTRARVSGVAMFLVAFGVASLFDSLWGLCIGIPLALVASVFVNWFFDNSFGDWG